MANTYITDMHVQTVYYITYKCRQEQEGNVKMCCDVNHKGKFSACGSL